MKFLEKPGVLPILLAMAGTISLNISSGFADSKINDLLNCKEITVETSDGELCNIENFSKILQAESHRVSEGYITEEIQLPAHMLASASVEPISPMALLRKVNTAIQSTDPATELSRLEPLLGEDPYATLSSVLGVDLDANEAVEIASTRKNKESINHSNWMNVASEYIQNAGQSKTPPRPIATASLQNLIKKVAKEKNVPYVLLLSIAEQESGFKSNAKSSAGAVGLCQVLPSTALWLAGKDFTDPEALAKMEEKLQQPEFNLRVSANYIKRLSSMFSGDLDKILAAYNAGPGNVNKHGGIPPFSETINYVHKVKARVVLNHEKYLVQQPRNNFDQNVLLVQNEDESSGPTIK